MQIGINVVAILVQDITRNIRLREVCSIKRTNFNLFVF